MTRKIIYSILFLFLIVDLGYSFVQYINQPLDGDMAWNLVPADEVKPIFNNPLGIGAILNNQTYPNPNRFFCHWAFREYLVSAPLLLQNLVGPIDSIYMSCAISKIVIHVLLILLLAMAITGTLNMFRMDFVLAAIIVSPLFQANGYVTYMGIDPSTTYAFFYALPSAILLLYLLPFIRQFYHDKEPSGQLYLKILWIPLAIVVSLSGPLNPGVVLIFSSLVVATRLINNFIHSNKEGFANKISGSISMIPKNYWFFLLPISLLSLYSLFLGKYNSITIDTQVPLSEMYLRLPIGVYYQFTQKLGFPVLFLILALNMVVISKNFKTVEGKKIMDIFKWIGIFSLCYVLLLPLGGYRVYRPNILRYDTIMPITLALMFVFGVSTLYLLKNISKKQMIWYLPILAGVLFMFVISDEPNFDSNKCERSALQAIHDSKDSVVQLHQDCSVLEWHKILEPEDSELNARLLKIWKVTDEKKLYYYKGSTVILMDN
ncbi:MAG: hypothetical protein DRJ05_05690 [Bacteroidetes bacterium]|nr:MAG: hypothetical protein DRJ05_05690 [Bacteroidota bacterium]